MAQIIIVGNEKGGSGKSTAAAHLCIGLMRAGLRVAALDLDTAQGTFARFLENRAAYAARLGVNLPSPTLHDVEAAATEDEAEAVLSDVLSEADADTVVVDTPGSATPLGRVAHSFADTLVTPLNDSFVDFDVLARIDPETFQIRHAGRYAEMVWEQKKRRAARDGGSVDWVVMRNRLSALDAVSKRQMAALLKALARRVGFRLVDGFGERVIYRELFPKGLTIMDIRETSEQAGLTLSHVAARQEVRSLVNAVTRTDAK
jgi:chromosome partitioning protein